MRFDIGLETFLHVMSRPSFKQGFTTYHFFQKEVILPTWTEGDYRKLK